MRWIEGCADGIEALGRRGAVRGGDGSSGRRYGEGLADMITICQ